MTKRRTFTVALSGAVALGLGALSAGALAESVAPKRPASTPLPFDGQSYDFAYDAAEAGRPERAWKGRAFVPAPAAIDAATARPLLVFVHGTNAEKIPYRWMGGGREGDVRRIVSELVAAGSVPPMLVAAPSAVHPGAVVNAVTSWPGLDLDELVDRAASRLAGVATIDRTRIVVAGHSGGGCNPDGGAIGMLRGKTKPLAVLAIDTCMQLEVAKRLAQAPPSTSVVVTWQTMSWGKRPFREFRQVFEREAGGLPIDVGVVRALEPMRPTEPMPHDAMVAATLRAWLPALLGRKAAPAAPAPPPTAGPVTPARPPTPLGR